MSGIWSSSNPPVKPGFYGTITTTKIHVSMDRGQYLSYLSGFIRGTDFNLPILGECLDWLVVVDADLAQNSPSTATTGLTIRFDWFPLSLNEDKTIEVKVPCRDDGRKFISEVFQIVEGAAYGE